MRRFQSTDARGPLFLGAIGGVLLIACSPLQRDLSELKQSGTETGGTTHAVPQGGAVTTPVSGTGGPTASLGGAALTTSEVAQVGGVSGQPVTASGGNDATSAAAAGSFGRGGAGSATAGGGSSGQAGSASAGRAPTGGSANGGTSTGRAGAGGTLASLAGRSGIQNEGGSLNIGGLSSVGGLPNGVGGRNVAGSSSTPPVCVPTGSEQCTDGVDNDCNGFVDCPIVNGRYPEPGRASSADDAWVDLSIPFRAVKRVECRSGRPSAVGAKTWETCAPLNPTALKVYSMGLTEARLDASNGITRFEFRFVYDNDLVSETNFILYYAHKSLGRETLSSPKLQCPPSPPDTRFFSAAAPYIVEGTTVPPFAPGDLLLKNPFIRLKFTPTHFGQFESPAPPQEVKVMSLRHRFVVDPTQKMLLVTRLYQSLRSGGSNCKTAVLLDHVSQVGAIVDHNRFYYAPCDAIVMNKAGAGVCLEAAGNTITVKDENSSRIIGFLNSLGIPWPKSDPLMWQRLFDDRAGRSSLQFFSDKCVADDASCRTTHPNALILPNEANDLYFTSP